MNVMRIIAVSAVCLWVAACQTPVASPPTFPETDDLADEVTGAPSGLTDASEPQQANEETDEVSQRPDRDNEPQAWDGFLDPDYIPVIEDSTPEDVPAEVFSVFGCIDLCDLQDSTGCTLPALGQQDCLSWCGDVESGACSETLTAVVDCVADSGAGLCDPQGAFTASGCEPAIESLTACLTLPPPDCESVCTSLAEAGCWFSPVDIDACTTACEQLATSSCNFSHQNWLDCVGHEPLVSCDAMGQPVVESCGAETAQLEACEDALVMTCTDLCDLYEAADCPNQRTRDLCKAGCIVRQAGPCAVELQALVDCAQDGPAVLCHPVSGLPAPAGCDAPLSALDVCLESAGQ